MSLFRAGTEKVWPHQIGSSVAAAGTPLIADGAGGAVFDSTGDIPVGAITPGTARQVMQTNAGATASEWTSSLALPGSLSVGTTSELTGNVGIGAASETLAKLRVAGSVTAATGAAYGFLNIPTLVAAANSDNLFGHRISNTRTPGAFTGLVAGGIDLAPFSVAAYTSPGDPFGIQVGVITGTGATNAYAIKLGAGPTGATNNYLFHATNAQITSAGAGNFATTVTAGTGITATTGAITATAGAVVAGTTVTAGTGLTVTTGGAAITGNSTITGTLGALTGLTVASGGASITGATAIVGAATLGDPAGTSAHVFDGTGYGAGVASIRLNGLSTAAVADQTGTLTNAPSAGNPVFWIPVNLAGSVRYIPAWA